MTRLTAVEQLASKRQVEEVSGVLTSLGLGCMDAPLVAGNIVNAFYADKKDFSHPAQLIFCYSLEEIADICETASLWDEQGGSVE